MITDELINYIQQSIQGGVSTETLRHTLVSGGGWSDADVTMALTEIQKKTVPVDLVKVASTDTSIEKVETLVSYTELPPDTPSITIQKTTLAELDIQSKITKPSTVMTQSIEIAVPEISSTKKIAIQSISEPIRKVNTFFPKISLSMDSSVSIPVPPQAQKPIENITVTPKPIQKPLVFQNMQTMRPVPEPTSKAAININQWVFGLVLAIVGLAGIIGMFLLLR
jgi:hypothetical protein